MISEHLKYKLDSIGSYLGGYSEMAKIYTEEELAYISLYPSDIFTVATWSTEEIIDLKVVGYIPFTEYFIYDKYHNLLIRNKSEGIIGNTEVEEELLEEPLRIDFVAYTRAKKNLYVMSADTQDDVSDFARYQRPHKTLAIIQQQK
jgi:hypothetical protein